MEARKYFVDMQLFCIYDNILKTECIFWNWKMTGSFCRGAKKHKELWLPMLKLNIIFESWKTAVILLLVISEIIFWSCVPMVTRASYPKLNGWGLWVVLSVLGLWLHHLVSNSVASAWVSFLKMQQWHRLRDHPEPFQPHLTLLPLKSPIFKLIHIYRYRGLGLSTFFPLSY